MTTKYEIRRFKNPDHSVNLIQGVTLAANWINEMMETGEYDVYDISHVVVGNYLTTVVTMVHYG